MRLVVTGRQGQIARSLMERARATPDDVVTISRPEIDLGKSHTILPALAKATPDIIVNAAAYTAVDAAEQDSEAALSINGFGAGAVAAAAGRLGIPVIQISTDYVFSGALDRPYREEDVTEPLGVYGESKRAGEVAVALATPNHAILRTAWIYSPYGKNFAKTMLLLARSHAEVSVVSDQHGTPNNALDLADSILKIAHNLLERPTDLSLRGTFHMSASCGIGWDDFARAIFDASAQIGGPTARVKSIPTKDYPTPARRPANSRLDCSKLAGAHGVTLPPWRTSLTGCIASLVAELNITHGAV